MDQPVTGLVTNNNVAYLASGSDGLVVVDISDLKQPHVLGNFGVPGNTATDVALNKNRGVLAMAVADPFGSGFIRFFDVNDPELDQPTNYGTFVFGSDEIAGQPVDIQWQGDSLYVLLNRKGKLYLVVLNNLDSQPTYTIQAIERGDMADELANVSMQVQYGQIALTSADEYLILQEDNQGQYQTVYWQSLGTGSELALNQGAIFLATGQGIQDTPTPDLAVTGFSPAIGATLTAGSTIRVQFNQLMNTDPALLATGLTIKDTGGNPLPTGSYTFTGINTLAGGYVDIRFADDLSYVGAITIGISTDFKALNGHALVRPVEVSYNLVAGTQPTIESVLRLVDGNPVSHYFHGDGSETALITGSGFGTTASDLQITIGDTEVPAANIKKLTDSSIQVDLPEIAVDLDAAALTVKVVRNGITATLAGAIVIQPRVILQDIDPVRGPPEGGNTVTLYGVGFNNQVEVTFGGVVAGDLRLLDSSRLEVRAPAGSFGYSDVTVTSRLFPDEESSLKDAYFYANKATGSVDLSQQGHHSSPVTGMVVNGQILYAVTGGGYQVVFRNGEQGPSLSTAKGQLVLSDISDPVHPILIDKAVADQQQPYHFDDSLPPDGFRDIALEGDDLYLLGGKTLYHFDVTLAAEPLLLSEQLLPGTGNHLVVSDQVIYVSTESGIAVYRLQPDRSLRHLATLGPDILGGAPGKLAIDGDLLWAALPATSRLVAIDLMDGLYQVVNRVETLDPTGRRVVPASFIIRNDLALVSTGTRGTVVAYGIRPDGQSQAVAELKLRYLLQGGDMYAGQLLLYGQTLYVASGQGDLQIFDISDWLDNRFHDQVELKNYFAVTGAVDAIAFGKGALYAGTAFVDKSGEPTENPLEVTDTKNLALGGALNTIVDNQLTIVSQTPKPRGRLQVDQPVMVQFNRILDPSQVEQFGGDLFTVTLEGEPVAGMVSAAINNMGTQLIFRPLSSFTPDKEYQVRLSAALKDLHGMHLAADYQFRFTADALFAPMIDSVQPAYGSWRGGEEIVITGEGFTNDSTIVIGGVEVPAQSVKSVSDSEITFILPQFSDALTESRLVGLAVANGNRRTFRAAAFTIVADPAITAIGRYNRQTATLAADDKRFLYNAGETVGVRDMASGRSLPSWSTANPPRTWWSRMPPPCRSQFRIGPWALCISK